MRATAAAPSLASQTPLARSLLLSIALCRAVKDEDGEARGVAGSAEVVCERTISCQPVAAFDWSGDKAGAFVAAAFDQTVRVGMASRVATL